PLGGLAEPPLDAQDPPSGAGWSFCRIPDDGSNLTAYVLFSAACLTPPRTLTAPCACRAARRIMALARKGSLHRPGSLPEDQTYADLAMVEGKVRLRLVAHRAREARLRDAKIRQVLDQRKP